MFKKIKNKKKIPIRVWLTWPIILILGFSMIITSSFLIFSSIRNSQLILYQIKTHVVNDVKSKITQKMSAAEQINKTNADMLKTGILNLSDRENRHKYFVNILKLSPEASMAFIGLPDGSFYGARRNVDGSIYVSEKDETTKGSALYYSTDEQGLAKDLEEEYLYFDARMRPWYTGAVEKEEMVYSDAYMHFIFQEPTITISKPVYDEQGELIGVFGTDYLFSWIDELLNQELIGEQGQMFISDENDLLISTTIDMDSYNAGGRKSGFYNINNLENQYVKKTVHALADRPSNTHAKVRFNEAKYHVTQNSLKNKNLNWDLYFLISEDDFIKNVKESIIYTVLSVLVLIIIFFLILNWLSKKITEPIEKLNKASKDLASGQVSTINNQSSIEELYGVTYSFNLMSNQLTDLVIGLEKEVLNRTYQLERTNKELEKLSFHDGLTGIYNRRKFDDYYHEIWQKALDNNYEIGLLIIDIDFFKKYNDTYGHLAGDEVLKIITQTIGKSIRKKEDILARYGGEEFVILAPRIQIKNLEKLAERIRNDVEELKIPHIKSKFKIVTISVGFSLIIPKEEDPIHKLIENSDRALYKAKNAGRNTTRKFNEK